MPTTPGMHPIPASLHLALLLNGQTATVAKEVGAAAFTVLGECRLRCALA